MTWALGLSVPVLACALALAWFFARRDGRVSGDGQADGPSDRDPFRLQVVGYRTNRVHEVLARLDAQIAANDALLRGEAPAEVARDADRRDDDPDTVYAHGAARCVWVDYPRRRSAPLPAAAREAILRPWHAPL